jgi:flagellar hook-length control protein FliK
MGAPHPVRIEHRSGGTQSSSTDRTDGANSVADPAAFPTATVPVSAVAVTLPTPATTDAPVPPPATQVASPLIPLRHNPDGIHRLTIHLNPVGLGPISVTAEVRAGEIHIQLAGATEAGREAMRSALPELRNSGYTACSFGLQQDTPGNGGGPGNGARHAQPVAPSAPATLGSDADQHPHRPTTPVAGTVRTTALDVHI